MPGFFISNDRCDGTLINLYPDRCVQEKVPMKNGTACRNTLRAFMADKAFFSDDEGAVVSEGVLLNKLELFRKYDCDCVHILLRKMFCQNGERFVTELRGPFSCALHISSEDLWLVYTNHVGDQTIYYSVVGERFYAGSQVNYVIDACRRKGLPLSLNEDAVYQLLTFGYMESDHTYAREIRRLRGGTYLRVERGHAEVREYYRFEKHPERFAGIGEKEILLQLDESFRHAVEMEYAKDEEYGKKHLSDISGGMDARMEMWVAHLLKPRHVLLFTYGMADYLDERYSKAIAAHWQDEILIKPLNDGSFLYDIDENTFMLGGLTSYERITGGKRTLETLNLSEYGLEHTGQVGDAIIGCFCKDKAEMERNQPRKRDSERLSHRLKRNGFHDSFTDHELYLLYTRGFQGACNTHQLRRNYAEPVSPFLDTDFLQLCMDIPMEMRTKRKLYNAWVMRYYPEAAEIPWEGTGGRIMDNHVQREWHRLKKRGHDKFMELIGKPEKACFKMDPIDYLARRGTKQRDYMDEYARKAFESLPVDLSETLENDMKEQYSVGNAIERADVLTVLSALKLYFSPAEKVGGGI